MKRQTSRHHHSRTMTSRIWSLLMTDLKKKKKQKHKYNWWMIINSESRTGKDALVISTLTVYPSAMDVITNTTKY